MNDCRWMLRIVTVLLLLSLGCRRMPEAVASLDDELNVFAIRSQEGGQLRLERL